MPDYQNTSYWLRTAPPFSAAPTDLPARAEIVILGAGVMGSSLAYHLAAAGQQALVLERNPHPAGGATGRNGGLVVGGPAQSYNATLHKLGRDSARAITELTRLNRSLIAELLARESIDAGYAVTGFVSLAAGPDEAAEAQASAMALRADGFAAEWLDRAAAEACLGTALGPRYVGALFKPEDGVIHSARYNFGVAQAAARRGARFAFGTRVERLEPGPGGRGWTITTARGSVFATQLVATLNAWAGDLFPELEGVIVPTRGHVILTAPVTFHIRPWSANWGWEYGRQLENGQLLVGGMRESRADLERGYRPPPGENVPDVQPELVASLAGFVPGHFPAAAGAPIVHHWTGLMGFTPDDQPLAGAWPGRDGLWLLAGFSGHGMPFSQVLPNALAARLTGKDGPAIPEAFSPARFLGAVQS
jgi:gamma-glutamylputrescine oxidase